METRMHTMVTRKQKPTIFPSHTAVKSTPERSRNSSAGRAAVNTNLLIRLTNVSSNKPILLKNMPKTMVKKTGIVAFTENIKLSIWHFLSSASNSAVLSIIVPVRPLYKNILVRTGRVFFLRNKRRQPFRTASLFPLLLYEIFLAIDQFDNSVEHSKYHTYHNSGVHDPQRVF